VGEQNIQLITCDKEDYDPNVAQKTSLVIVGEG
jgi:hypothetical protein